MRWSETAQAFVNGVTSKYFKVNLVNIEKHRQ